jgi:hypothetical protein
MHIIWCPTNLNDLGASRRILGHHRLIDWSPELGCIVVHVQQHQLHTALAPLGCLDVAISVLDVHTEMGGNQK